MEYTRLGSTGLKVSKICLGMMSYGDPAKLEWSLPEEQAEPLVKRAIEAGITFFDTADVYSAGTSEVITGNVLRRLLPRRDDYVLATKVFFPVRKGVNEGGLSRKHIMAAIDASLDRLGTDYVDLYQIHRWDPETPVEETMEALHDVVRSGKARYIGASSMAAWQFSKAQYTASANGWTRFVSMQNHYNLLYREEEREMLPLCLDQGVGVIPWSPLARGVLARAGSSDAGTARATSKDAGRIEYLYGKDADQPILDRVAQVARERELPAAQIALAWLLHQPGLSAPIIGATKDRHIDDAVAAVGVSLSDKELAFLAEPYTPREVRD
ncbi:aldo/keto reductase [Nonomuraea soli]|uniref:Aryl-alcohol dehydrogenase-like predicted oxidoreductase n=1 Tax=Nonomuraea soli TaxID=1032476 RepID=A0A7W0CPB7_9ACTN|nr:aldo/keto reductase [Nonomuraea soli]MBA2894891.1 aryl-alcohol dehydrogenase-like predicted oxidoreductase [Nonomuraea soli]